MCQCVHIHTYNYKKRANLFQEVQPEQKQSFTLWSGLSAWKKGGTATFYQKVHQTINKTMDIISQHNKTINQSINLLFYYFIYIYLHTYLPSYPPNTNASICLSRNLCIIMTYLLFICRHEPVPRDDSLRNLGVVNLKEKIKFIKNERRNRIKRTP